jgi:predicted Zn finger-like uncharacterized protein
MNVSCPECRSVFRVDPRKVPLHGVSARCSVCGGVLSIARSGSIDDSFAAFGEVGSTSPPIDSYSSFYSAEESTAPASPVVQSQPGASAERSFAAEGVWSAPAEPSPSASPSQSESPHPQQQHGHRRQRRSRCVWSTTTLQLRHTSRYRRSRQVPTGL